MDSFNLLPSFEELFTLTLDPPVVPSEQTSPTEEEEEDVFADYERNSSKTSWAMCVIT
jgi:hypothetical protein